MADTYYEWIEGLRYRVQDGQRTLAPVEQPTVTRPRHVASLRRVHVRRAIREGRLNEAVLIQTGAMKTLPRKKP